MHHYHIQILSTKLMLALMVMFLDPEYNLIISGIIAKSINDLGGLSIFVLSYINER